jgi:hypothetical protein
MQLVSELNNYYGDSTRTIYPDTEATVIFYRVTELIDGPSAKLETVGREA